MTAVTQHRLAAAIAPIESTGRLRHDVALLIASRQGYIDTRFRRIGEHLSAGDVVVVNTSTTEPAALVGSYAGAGVGLHVSGPAPGGDWFVELRAPDRSGPILSAAPGERVELADGTVTLMEPAALGESEVRLWIAEWAGRRSLVETLRSHGRPIRYSYIPEDWPIEVYQTVFGIRRPEFSSAEMPSAARPFTRRVIGDLRRRGVQLAAVTLHTGVSSPERHEAPMPERYEVDESAATIINRARENGRRIVAVGTTSVRAIESAGRSGEVTATRGWTDLVLGPERPAVIVDGLVTGWHPPEASHLDLIEAVVGPDIVSGAYRSAHELGYRSHEFGDSCLLLRS